MERPIDRLRSKLRNEEQLFNALFSKYNIYKHISKTYGDLLLKRGNIKLSSQESFYDIENAPNRSDKHECSAEELIHLGKPNGDDDPVLNKLLKQTNLIGIYQTKMKNGNPVLVNGKRVSERKLENTPQILKQVGINISNVHMDRNVRLAYPMLIYCVTYDCNSKHDEEYYIELYWNYKTICGIRQAIERSLGVKVIYMDAKPCCYDKNARKLKNASDSEYSQLVFAKPGFDDEKEIRFVFYLDKAPDVIAQKTNNASKWVALEVPELRKSGTLHQHT